MEKSIRCALYDRVSTDIQVKDGLSLEAQKQALTEYALSHNYQIVGYYSDEGITARKKMQNRRELQRLLNDVKADRIDLILVTKLDRWFRNIKDYHNTQAILEAHGCNWKTIFEEYDTSTSNGRFAINIMLSVNENECDRDSERIKSVFAYKKRNREHLNGRPAYGYTTDAQKHLVKDPATMHIVEDIFRTYCSTYSKKATVRRIQETYGEASPTMYQINRVLSSETYTGLKFGIAGYCEPYITQEQFQKIRQVSDSKLIPHQTEPFLFSSMIRCPVCGKNMSGFVKRQRLKDGSTSEYKRYRCGAKFTEFHNGACISESVVEKYLLDNIVLRFKETMLDLEKNSQNRRGNKKNQTAAIQAEIERLNLLFQKGRIKADYYDEQYEMLSAKLAACEPPEPAISPKACRTLAAAFEGGWISLYEKLDAAHKKAFWKGILKEISIDKDSHKISGFTFYL